MPSHPSALVRRGAAALALAATLTACSHSDDTASAAHDKACRTFELLAGAAADQAAPKVANAAERGGWNADRLGALLTPVADASLRAGLVYGLSDSDYAVFRDVRNSATTVQNELTTGFHGSDVSALKMSLTEEQNACSD